MSDASCSYDPTLVRQLTTTASLTWVGALSFEERCVGSLEQLARIPAKVRRVIAFDYSTGAVPEPEAEERRRIHWERMLVLADKLGTGECRREAVAAYSYSSCEEVLSGLGGSDPSELTVLDITCMTKLHAVAAGAFLARGGSSRGWIVAYSIPRSFCDLVRMDRRFGWRDILIVPLVEQAVLYNEAASRGVIILGHEQDRLVVGLRELQPAGGTIVFPWEAARPDLRFVMERNNRYIVRELAPRPGVGWRTERVEVDGTVRLNEVVHREAEQAKAGEAPVILFPMGPKIMVFCAARAIAERYRAGGWVVYPVPGGYDPDYSEGVEKTLWFGDSWHNAIRCPAAGIGEME